MTDVIESDGAVHPSKAGPLVRIEGLAGRKMWAFPIFLPTRSTARFSSSR